MGGQDHAPTAFLPGNTPQEAGLAPWPDWRCVEKRNSLVPTWVRTLNRSHCSESLYRLRYPGSNFLKITFNIMLPFLFGSFYMPSSRQFSDQDFVRNFYFSFACLIIFYTKRDRIFRRGLYFEILCNVGAWNLSINLRNWGLNDSFFFCNCAIVLGCVECWNVPAGSTLNIFTKNRAICKSLAALCSREGLPDFTRPCLPVAIATHILRDHACRLL